MKLYHGTSIRHLDGILEDGIKPRGLTNNSNWGHCAPSHSNMVYLTDTWAAHYAKSASDRDPYKFVVIEVDTDKLDAKNLYPDEDYLCDFLHESGADGLGKHWEWEIAIKSACEKVRDYQYLWSESIEKFGTLAHYGIIPPSAFTRYSVFDYGHSKWSYGMTTWQYDLKTEGDAHKAILRFLMGEPVKRIELEGLSGVSRISDLDLKCEQQSLLKIVEAIA